MNKILSKETPLRNIIFAEQSTPPPFVWDNIEKELDTGKKSLLYLILIGGLVILLFIVGYLAYSYQNNNIAPASERIIAPLAPSLQEPPVQKPLRTKTVTPIIEKTVKKDNQSSIQKTPLIVKNTKEKNSAINIKSIALERNEEVQNAYSTITKKGFSNTFLSINKLNATLVQIADIRPNILMKNEISCPGEKSSKLTFFLETNILFGRQFKKLGTTNNPELKNIRNNTEYDWYSWGANLQGGIHFSRSIYLGTGVEWTQSKDKFDYSKEAITKLIITYDPVTNLPIDSSFVTGSISNKGEIRYNKLDIPIYFGYSKETRNWNYGIELGMLFNLKFAVEGKTMDNNLLVSRVENTPNMYKPSLGWGYRVSFVLGRPITNELSIILKPTYKKYLNNINTASYPIETSIQEFRLSLGLRKIF